MAILTCIISIHDFYDSFYCMFVFQHELILEFSALSAHRYCVSGLCHCPEGANCKVAKRAHTAYVNDQVGVFERLERALEDIFRTWRPEITRVVFSNRFTGRMYSKQMRPYLQDFVVSRDCVRTSHFVMLMRALASTGTKIKELTTEGYWIMKHDVDGSRNCYIWCCPGSHIRGTSCNGGTQCWGESRPALSSSAFVSLGKDLDAVKNVFAGLTTLSLDILPQIDPIRLRETSLPPWYSKPGDYWGALPEILKCMPKLQSLSFDLHIHWRPHTLDGHYYSRDDVDDLFRLKGWTIMPELNSLSLKHFRTQDHTLARLLANHKRLRHLCLHHALARWPDRNWTQTVEEMRKLRLRSLDLYGVDGFGCSHDGNSSNPLETYLHDNVIEHVLYGYRDDPFVEPEPEDGYDGSPFASAYDSDEYYDPNKYVPAEYEPDEYDPDKNDPNE